MGSSTAIRTGKHASDSNVKNEPSKGKTIGFAIVIILGLGGLAVAGLGLGGYVQAGSLSSLGKVHSIVMMVAGGVGGIAFLIIGVVGSVKNRQTNSHHQNDSTGVEHSNIVNPRDDQTSSTPQNHNAPVKKHLTSHQQNGSVNPRDAHASSTTPKQHRHCFNCRAT